MAFTSGSATSQEDLIGQLHAFAQANGWTEDELDNVNNVSSLSRGGTFVHFAWDGSEAGGADNIAIAQSTAFSGTGRDIDDHTNDSGNGVDAPFSSSSLSLQRRISGIGNGPFTSHHFYEHDLPFPYIHCVLEFAPGIYRHFGFGTIDKIGDWTGGEYVYGHVWDEDGSSDDNPIASNHTLMLDGLCGSTTGTDELNPATLHIEGLPNQPSPGRYGHIGGGGAAWIGVDGNGDDRVLIVGGMRGGFWCQPFAWVGASPLNGFIPLIPIPLAYQVPSTSSPIHYILLGFMSDVRHIQMEDFNPGETVTIGSDTWRIFPGVRKRFLGDNEQETRNMGIAYRQVT